MQKLITAYTMYFNKRYERTGALFQGRFKAEHVDDDEYLKYLLSYIHLNPAKLIDPEWKNNPKKEKRDVQIFLEKFEHSSFIDYSEKNQRAQEAILEKSALPEYFESGEDFKKNMFDWLKREPFVK